MTENQAAEIARPPVAERDPLVAIGGLASEMLETWGSPNEGILTWDDGQREYLLMRTANAEVGDQQLWLYAMNPDAEHDAYDLTPGGPLSDEPELRKSVRTILRGHATQRLMQTIQERIGSRKELYVEHDSVRLRFEDFSSAEHEPFVWIRVGEMAFDLSPSGLRQATRRIRNQAVPADLDDQIVWLMRAAGGPEASDRGWRPARRYLEPHSYDRRAPMNPVDMSDHTMSELSRHATIIEGISHDGIEYVHDNGITSIRTAMPFARTREDGSVASPVMTTVGVRCSTAGMYIETIAAEGDVRSNYRVDFSDLKAAGDILDRTRRTTRTGEQAARDVLSILHQLDDHIDDTGTLTRCTEASRNLFQHPALRDPNFLMQGESSVQ